VRVQVLVDTVGDSIAVAGVDANFAFVAVRDDHPGQFPRSHRQSAAVVDRVAKRPDCAAQFRGLQDPAGEVVISECSDSAHGEMVRLGLPSPEPEVLRGVRRAVALSTISITPIQRPETNGDPSPAP
jgi:hypothetical protein